MSLSPRLCTAWVLTASVLVCAVAAGTARAALGPPSGDFSVRVWQTEEGLPQNSVNAITQTRDGYIWIGTYDGLARFDGERFQNFNAVNTPNLEDSQIISLFEDDRGVLWIGHDSGIVTCYRAGHFERLRRNTGAGVRVAAIGADPAGAVWLLRQDGNLESAADGRVLPPVNGRKPSEVVGMARDASGQLYVVRDGDVSRLSGEKLDPVDFGAAAHTGYAMGLGTAADGGLWVIRDWRVRKWIDRRWTEDRGPCPWGDAAITSVIELRDGSVAVATMDQGFYLLFPNHQVRHFDRTSGLPQNWVRFLYEDREGTLWVGIGTGGLVAVRPTAFTSMNAPDQWQGRTVLSIASGRDGALWIGTEGSGLYRYRQGSWSHYGREEGLENLFVWSVAEDPHGQIWAGTWGGGIYRLQNDRCIAAVECHTGAASVRALQFTPEDHALWAGAGNQLIRWGKDTTSWAFDTTSGAAVHVCTVARDNAGDIWIGTAGGGLGRLSHNTLTRFRKSDGLSSDSVQCLLPGDDGVLWIGTADGGLDRLKDGRFSTIGVDQGLASGVICHIVDDAHGYLWLSTHHGILRLAKAELNRCADGLAATVGGQMYDRNDGLPTIEYSGGLQSAGCRTTDGRLWFTSSKGLVCVDPASIRMNLAPPPVVFEALRVDGRLIGTDGEASAGPRLPPDHERLEFQYTALSLIAPSKVVFKHRLVGLDKDWVDAGTKRSAFYSHLPPGSYSFQVIACNNDGVWNTEGVRLAFIVLPFFWQTWWFVGLAGLFVSSAVAWSVRHETRRRMQRRVEQLEREHAIERERTRIAQDIHDDIGASLTRISMLSHSAGPEASQPAGAAAVLEQISSTAREVTRALDEIVWAVDPRHDTLESLVCYMSKFAQDFLGVADVRCRLDLPVELPAWPLSSETRHHLFLAFKEALNNAVKHAAATEVRVSLALRLRAFVLSVQDNGRGIDRSGHAPCAPNRFAAGNGLLNLQRRLAQIGGHCEIVTRAEAGTTVSFILDASGDEPQAASESGAQERGPPEAGVRPLDAPI